MEVHCRAIAQMQLPATLLQVEPDYPEQKEGSPKGRAPALQGLG
jgi:hypothetical protein